MLGMHMTLDVSGNGVFRPFPILQSLGKKFELARRRGKSDASLTVDFYSQRGAVSRDDFARLIDYRIRELRRFNAGLMNSVDMILDEKCAVFTHILERRKVLLSGGLRQARNAIIEDPTVVVVDRHLRARFIRRFKKLANSQCAVRIDAPGELDPEFVFFPDLADSRCFVGFIGGVEFLSLFFQRDTQDWLPEADPARGLRFLTHQIVAL